MSAKRIGAALDLKRERTTARAQLTRLENGIRKLHQLRDAPSTPPRTRSEIETYLPKLEASCRTTRSEIEALSRVIAHGEAVRP